MKDWHYWLKATAKYYRVSQESLLLHTGKSRAKSTFYWLVFKDGLDLAKTSMEIGKEKTTLVKFISRNAKKENDRYRDKSAEEYILNKSI